MSTVVFNDIFSNRKASELDKNTFVSETDSDNDNDNDNDNDKQDIITGDDNKSPALNHSDHSENNDNDVPIFELPKKRRRRCSTKKKVHEESIDLVEFAQRVCQQSIGDLPDMISKSFHIRDSSYRIIPYMTSDISNLKHRVKMQSKMRADITRVHSKILSDIASSLTHLKMLSHNIEEMENTCQRTKDQNVCTNNENGVYTYYYILAPIFGIIIVMFNML